MGPLSPDLQTLAFCFLYFRIFFSKQASNLVANLSDSTLFLIWDLQAFLSCWWVSETKCYFWSKTAIFGEFQRFELIKLLGLIFWKSKWLNGSNQLVSWWCQTNFHQGWPDQHSMARTIWDQLEADQSKLSFDFVEKFLLNSPASMSSSFRFWPADTTAATTKMLKSLIFCFFFINLLGLRFCSVGDLIGFIYPYLD